MTYTFCEKDHVEIMPMSPSSPMVRIPVQPEEFVREYNEIDWGEEIMAREGLQLTSLKYVDEKF